MSGVNKVILIGNLGQDPEITNTSSGKQVAKFSIATSETFKKGDGKVTQTEWHRVEVWEGLAKIAEAYLKKGNSVYIEGKIKTESWEDKDGNKKTGTKIIGTSLTLLGGNNSSPASREESADKEEKQDQKEQGSDIDDMPF